MKKYLLLLLLFTGHAFAQNQSTQDYCENWNEETAYVIPWDGTSLQCLSPGGWVYYQVNVTEGFSGSVTYSLNFEGVAEGDSISALCGGYIDSSYRINGDYYIDCGSQCTIAKLNEGDFIEFSTDIENCCEGDYECYGEFYISASLSSTAGPSAVCGDGTCDLGEHCTFCPADCLGAGQVCCVDVGAVTGDCCSDSDCPEGACVSNNCESAEPAGSVCGDGTCDSIEDCSSCPADCLAAGQVCCQTTAYAGDCCSDSDCAGSDTCESKVCTAAVADVPEEETDEEADEEIVEEAEVQEVAEEVNATKQAAKVEEETPEIEEDVAPEAEAVRRESEETQPEPPVSEPPEGAVTIGMEPGLEEPALISEGPVPVQEEVETESQEEMQSSSLLDLIMLLIELLKSIFGSAS